MRGIGARGLFLGRGFGRAIVKPHEADPAETGDQGAYTGRQGVREVFHEFDFTPKEDRFG